MKHKEGDVINSVMPPAIAKKLTKKYNALNNRMRKGGMSPFEEIKIIYDFMDFFNKSVHEKNAVCKSGCSHCCYIDISLSPAEALYISHNTGVAYDNTAQGRPLKKGTPCPFLNVEHGMCRIYEFRPVVCRNYFTFDDPKLCWPPDQVHLVSGVRNGFSNETIMHLAAGVYNMSQPVIELDVRQWFPHGLK